MHDDEHVLRGILERRLGDAERAQHAPDEREVRRVDLVERRHGDLANQRVCDGGHSRCGCRDRGGSVTKKPLHGRPTSRPQVARAEAADGA